MPAIARAIVTSQRVARSRRGMRAGSDGVVVFGVFGAVLSVESVGGFQVEVDQRIHTAGFNEFFLCTIGLVLR